MDWPSGFTPEAQELHRQGERVRQKLGEGQVRLRLERMKPDNADAYLAECAEFIRYFAFPAEAEVTIEQVLDRYREVTGQNPRRRQRR